MPSEPLSVINITFISSPSLLLIFTDLAISLVLFGDNPLLPDIIIYFPLLLFRVPPFKIFFPPNLLNPKCSNAIAIGITPDAKYLE